MKKTISLLFLLTCLSTMAQIRFEKGYFIDNNGDKQEGYIKNYEWKNTPSDIEFKSADQEPSSKLEIQEVASFFVGNQLYKRFTGQIDRSSSILEKMTSSKNPIFKEETIFLLQLVDGQQKLYVYNDKSLSRYFYGAEDHDITQLVYKKYLKNQSTVAENNLYQQQILQELNCNSISQNRIQHTSYTKNDLVDLFKDYNLCINPDLTFETKKRKGSFQINIRPGITFNEFKITGDDSFYQQDDFVNFGNSPGFRFGIEGEYIMPFNKNKWSATLEPTFHFFNDSGYDYNENPTRINYSAFELPIGIRHYMFLNDENKLFVNASLMLIFPMNSEVEIETPFNYNFEKSPNYALGIGYKFKEKFSFEFQYKGSQNWYYDPRYNKRLSELRGVSFILGYSLF